MVLTITWMKREEPFMSWNPVTLLEGCADTYAAARSAPVATAATLRLFLIRDAPADDNSDNDHSLFTKSKNNKFIAVLVYVDDIVVTGNCVDEIDKFKSFLKSKKYCLELLKDYGLHGCKTVFTPMVPNSVLPYEPTEDDPLLDNITQYMHSPLKSHLSCALNALRYLKGAPGKGIRYKYPDINDTICGYSDAD
ncbi:hypothetical protein Tco_1027741 [Tanacetum coccineum]